MPSRSSAACVTCGSDHPPLKSPGRPRQSAPGTTGTPEQGFEPARPQRGRVPGRERYERSGSRQSPGVGLSRPFTLGADVTISTDDGLLKDMTIVVNYPAEQIVPRDELLPGVVQADGSRVGVAVEPGVRQGD